MKKTLVYEILEGILFALSGMAMSVSLTGFIEQLASDAPVLVRYLPLFFIAFALLSVTFCLHVVLHPRSRRTYRLGYIVGGILSTVFGAAAAITSVILFANGTFDSFVGGGITWIYPLDSLIFGFLFDFLGLFAFLYGVKKAKNDEVKVVPVTMWKRIVFLDILVPFYCAIACFFSVPISLFFLTYDYSAIHFFATLPWYMLMLLPCVELAFYEYYLRKLEGQKKFQVTLKAGTIFLALGLVFSIYGYFSSSAAPTAIAESLIFAFPLDFMVSRPIGFVLLYLINILPPMGLLLSEIFSQPKSRKEE